MEHSTPGSCHCFSLYLQLADIMLLPCSTNYYDWSGQVTFLHCSQSRLLLLYCGCGWVTVVLRPISSLSRNYKTADNRDVSVCCQRARVSLPANTWHLQPRRERERERELSSSLILSAQDLSDIWPTRSLSLDWRSRPGVSVTTNSGLVVWLEVLTRVEKVPSYLLWITTRGF